MKRLTLRTFFVECFIPEKMAASSRAMKGRYRRAINLLGKMLVRDARIGDLSHATLDELRAWLRGRVSWETSRDSCGFLRRMWRLAYKQGLTTELPALLEKEGEIQSVAEGEATRSL